MSNNQHQKGASSGQLHLTPFYSDQSDGLPDDGQPIVENGRSTVGTHENCSVVLNSEMAQPLHCLLIRGSAGTVIRSFHEDTKLNGEAVRDAWVQPGDTISASDVELRLESKTIGENQEMTEKESDSSNPNLPNSGEPIVNASNANSIETTSPDTGPSNHPADANDPENRTQQVLDLIERLGDLENQLEQLKESNSSLEEKATTLEKQVTDRLDEVDRLQEQNSNLQQQLESAPAADQREEQDEQSDTTPIASDSAPSESVLDQSEPENPFAAIELIDQARSSEFQPQENPSNANSWDADVRKEFFEELKEFEQLEELNPAGSAEQDQPESDESVDPIAAIAEAFPEIEHFATTEESDGTQCESEPQIESELQPEPEQQQDPIELEAEPLLESEPLPETELQPESSDFEAESQLEFEPQLESEPLPETELQPESSDFEAESQLEFEPQLESEPLPETDPQPESSDFEAESQLEIEPQLESEPLPETDPQPESSDFEAESQLEFDPQLESEPLPETDPQPESSDFEAESQLEFDPQLESEPLPETEPKPESSNFEAESQLEFDPQLESVELEAEPIADPVVEAESIESLQANTFEEDSAEGFNSVEVEEEVEQVNPTEAVEEPQPFESAADEPQAIFAEQFPELDQFVPPSEEEEPSSQQDPADLEPELTEPPVEEPSSENENLFAAEGIGEHAEPADFVDESQACEPPATAEPLNSPESQTGSSEIEFNFELAESNFAGVFGDLDEQDEPESSEPNPMVQEVQELEYTESTEQPNNESDILDVQAENFFEAVNAEDETNPYSQYLDEPETQSDGECFDEGLNQTEPEPSDDGLTTSSLLSQFEQAASDTFEPETGEAADEEGYRLETAFSGFETGDQAANSSFSPLQPLDEDAQEEAPENSSAPTEPPAESNPTGDSEDSYIQEYMKKLLGNGEVEAGETVPETEEPEEVEPEGPSLLEKTFEAEIKERQELLKPSEFVPKTSAPEKNSNLQAMRELANQSARSAIETSSRKRKFEQQSMFVLIGAGICFFIGASLAMLSSNLLSLPAIGSAIFFSATGFGAWYYFDMKNNAEKSGDDSPETAEPADDIQLTPLEDIDVPEA